MTDVPAGVVVVECEEYQHIDVEVGLWLSEGHETRFNSEIDGRDILRDVQKGRAEASGHLLYWRHSTQ